MQRLCTAVISLATLSTLAHADTSRLFAQEPHNGAINHTGVVTAGMYVTNNPGLITHTSVEFDLRDFASLAGNVIVHSARFEIYSTAVSVGSADRLAFYGYEGDGAVTTDDFAVGDFLERRTSGSPLGQYFGIDVTAWFQSALDDEFDWGGINIRNETDVLSIVNIARNNFVVGSITLEYAPRLIVDYSVLGAPAVPLPTGGALAGATLLALGARRRR